MTLICIASPKGGVGKTTLTANLAYTLQRHGLNVTVIDFDSQDALKLHFGIPFNEPQGYVAEAPTTLYWQELVRTSPNGINILPYGHPNREERKRFDRFLADDDGLLLQQALSPFYNDKDCVLLADMPPGHSTALEAISKLNPIYVTALLADSASVAVLPNIEDGEFYSTESQRNIYYVINQLDVRNELGRDVYGMLRQRLGSQLLGVVHRDPAVSEAHALQISILQHAYNSAVVDDLENIANNLIRLMPEHGFKPTLTGR